MVNNIFYDQLNFLFHVLQVLNGDSDLTCQVAHKNSPLKLQEDSTYIIKDVCDVSFHGISICITYGDFRWCDILTTGIISIKTKTSYETGIEFEIEYDNGSYTTIYFDCDVYTYYNEVIQDTELLSIALYECE